MSDRQEAFTPFSFVLVADPHLRCDAGDGIGAYQAFADLIRSDETVDFVLCLGDLGWKDSDDAELEALLALTGKPTYSVYGNHDWAELERYEEILQPRNHVFNHKGCTFVLFWNSLASAEAPGHHGGGLSAEGWAWLESAVRNARNTGCQHLFVAAHVPPRCSGMLHHLFLEPEDDARFRRLCLENEISAGFFGHIHQEATFRIGPTDIVVTPSLSWNFTPRQIGTWHGKWPRYDKVKNGAYRVVRVSDEGIEHSLIQMAGESL